MSPLHTLPYKVCVYHCIHTYLGLRILIWYVVVDSPLGLGAYRGTCLKLAVLNWKYKGSANIGKQAGTELCQAQSKLTQIGKVVGKKFVESKIFLGQIYISGRKVFLSRKKVLDLKIFWDWIKLLDQKKISGRKFFKSKNFLG